MDPPVDMLDASPATQRIRSPLSRVSVQTVPRTPARCTIRCATPRNGTMVPGWNGAAFGNRPSRAAIRRRGAARSPWRRPACRAAAWSGSLRGRSDECASVWRRARRCRRSRTGKICEPCLTRRVRRFVGPPIKEGASGHVCRFRASEVRPDSAISAAIEIARRKNKSFAQYTGADRSISLYRMGLEQKFSSQRLARYSASKNEIRSFFHWIRESAFPWVSIRGLPRPSDRITRRVVQRKSRVYNALRNDARENDGTLTPPQRPSHAWWSPMTP